MAMCPRLVNEVIDATRRSVGKFCVICGTRGHFYTHCSERSHTGCAVCGASDHVAATCEKKVRVTIRGFDKMGMRRGHGVPDSGPLDSQIKEKKPRTINSAELFREVQE